MGHGPSSFHAPPNLCPPLTGPTPAGQKEAGYGSKVHLRSLRSEDLGFSQNQPPSPAPSKKNGKATNKNISGFPFYRHPTRAPKTRPQWHLASAPARVSRVCFQAMAARALQWSSFGFSSAVSACEKASRWPGASDPRAASHALRARACESVGERARRGSGGFGGFGGEARVVLGWTFFSFFLVFFGLRRASSCFWGYLMFLVPKGKPKGQIEKP